MMIFASVSVYASNTATAIFEHTRTGSGTIADKGTSVADKDSGIGTHTFTVTTNDPNADVSFSIASSSGLLNTLDRTDSNGNLDEIPVSISAGATQDDVTKNSNNGVGQVDVAVEYTVELSSQELSDNTGTYTGVMTGTLTYSN
jgi:hypothetical protein